MCGGKTDKAKLLEFFSKPLAFRLKVEVIEIMEKYFELEQIKSVITIYNRNRMFHQSLECGIVEWD